MLVTWLLPLMEKNVAAGRYMRKHLELIWAIFRMKAGTKHLINAGVFEMLVT